MKPQDPATPPSPAELAALHVSGAMTDEDRALFDRWLMEGRADLAAEVAGLRAAGEALAALVPPVIPPPALRDRVLELAAASPPHRSSPAPEPQVWRGWADDSAAASLFTLRADQGAWTETGVHGVQVRRLFVDRPNNRMTAMFRMAAGTSYPQHVHDGPEECYVLQGDLHVGEELVMRAGDYQRAESRSRHGRQWTEGGCTLLVSCALTDELA
jgi:anti-sigma factor ChrR (cupin superfamily)